MTGRTAGSDLLLESILNERRVALSFSLKSVADASLTGRVLRSSWGNRYVTERSKRPPETFVFFSSCREYSNCFRNERNVSFGTNARFAYIVRRDL